MKNKSNYLLIPVLALCILLSAPLGTHAVQVKTNNGEIAASVEQESGVTGGPVYANQVADGTYDIAVESSSSMFRVTACRLTVKDGVMSARMTLGGTAYEKLYMGSDSEAAAAQEADWIPYEENADGSYSYTVPVEALNQEITCAAFSSRSQKWFPRTLVFQSSSLPEGVIDESALAGQAGNGTGENASASESVDEAEEKGDAGSAPVSADSQEPANNDTAGENGADESSASGKSAYQKASDVKTSKINYAPVTLADGTYRIPVTLAGGSGKASVTSPAEMTVKNRRATARIEWSSPHYDYMVVDGLLYEPVNSGGNSVFEIPVIKFDGGMNVIADTTAMSQPHEIAYTLNFDLEQAEPQGMSVKTKGFLMLGIILAVIILGFIRGRLRSGKARYDEMMEEAAYEKAASAKPVSKKKKKLR